MIRQYNFLNEVIFRGPLSHIPNEATTEKQLIQFFNDPNNASALFLCSPTFYDSFNKFKTRSEFDDKEKVRVLSTLYKYYKRITTRTTPFGLMAGCGIVSWSEEQEETRIEIKNKTYNVRLDMQVSVAIIQKVSKIERLYKWQKFKLNDTVYCLENSVRYIERKFNSKGWTYQISEVNLNRVLGNLVDDLKHGQYYSLPQLTAFIEKLGFSHDQSESYIKKLISSEFLVSELYPELTGKELMAKLTSFIANVPIEDSELKNIDKRLQEIVGFLKQLENTPIYSEKIVDQVCNELEKLEVSFSRNFAVQIDSYLEFDKKTLNLKWQKKLINAINFLDKNFGGPLVNQDLEFFKERFNSRYGENEMPLLLALDSEFGLGYGHKTSGTGDSNPYLAQFDFPASDNTVLNWRQSDSILLKKLLQCRSQDNKVIKLEESDFRNVEFNIGKYSDSLGVMFRLIEENGEEKLFLEYACGPSALNLLGRFTSGNEELNRICKYIADFEQSKLKNSVYAEIIHLPASRVGNILRREALSKYEIPYLANHSSNSSIDSIPPDDLMLSVLNDRIILRSKSLKQEVLPKMSNAHNFRADALPVYQFLCDLQTQGGREDIDFTWGPLEKDYKRLPRVEFNDIILERASWHLDQSDKDQLIEILESENDPDLRHWFKINEIPNTMCVLSGDQELEINLESKIARKTLLFELKKNEPTLKIVESFSSKLPQGIESNNSQKVVNQFYGILLKESTDSFTSDHFYSLNKEPYVKNIPGSSWIYLKIYAGTHSLELILINSIMELVELLFSKKIIQRWHFVRYADPEEHLRIRFNASESHSVIEVVQHIHENLLSQLTSNYWKVQFDTYIPEIDRYLGTSGVSITEDIFSLESEFSIQIIKLCNTSTDEKARWKILYYAIDSFLNSFGFNLKGKKDLLQFMADAYRSEFKIDKILKGQINLAYRKEKATIDKIIEGKHELILDLDQNFDLQERILSLQLHCELIDEIINQEEEKSRYFSYVSSLIHMLVNKVLRSNHRKNELVIYTFMYLNYRSKTARLRQSEIKPPK